jgi:hypothetical protein
MNFKFAIKDIEKFKDAVDFSTDRDFVISLKLKKDQWINGDTWKERNIMFHRKFFAFLNAAIYLFPEDKKYDSLRNIDYLRKKLMIMIGEVDSIYDMEGREHMQAKSISFKSMDDEAFDRIYKACITAVLNNFLHDISMKDFEDTILTFI